MPSSPVNHSCFWHRTPFKDQYQQQLCIRTSDNFQPYSLCGGRHFDHNVTRVVGTATKLVADKDATRLGSSLGFRFSLGHFLFPLMLPERYQTALTPARVLPHWLLIVNLPGVTSSKSFEVTRWMAGKP